MNAEDEHEWTEEEMAKAIPPKVRQEYEDWLADLKKVGLKPGDQKS